MPQPFVLYYFLGKCVLRSKQPFLQKLELQFCYKFETPESFPVVRLHHLRLRQTLVRLSLCLGTDIGVWERQL